MKDLLIFSEKSMLCEKKRNDVTYDCCESTEGF